MRSNKTIIFLVIIALILGFNLRLAVAADMKADETVDFTLTITNSGSVPIGSVSGTASIDGDFSIDPPTFSVGSILSNGSETFIFKVKSPPQPDPANPVIMTGTATFTVTSVKNANWCAPLDICTTEMV